MVPRSRLRQSPRRSALVASRGVPLLRPVTGSYPGTAPWAFTGGTINRVAIDVSGEPYVDLEREAQAMLMRE
ncbi:hypothetical protein [Cryobacterium tagatosivorans]|uniref:Uncharacterized protein n=1 Tax=Cryobacterium tagatosivorans TaxID=1259199 RepID=A0A4R8UHG0_9MICO|nr:hypothetical protein [Cryobacterium tagatosivorans]TFB52824.1 hypothetical protein E3O23_05870 [Cryobacterium tagatosivorans]